MFGIFSRLFGSRESSDPYGAPERPPGVLRGIGFLLGSILMFPIRVLFYPFEVIIRAIRRPDDYDGPYERKGAAPKGILAATGFWLKKILQGIIMLPVLLIKAPFVLIHGLVTGQRTDLLFVLPALAMFGFFGFVFYQVFAKGDEIEARYRNGAYGAIADQDFQLAKTYFKRLSIDSQLGNNDQLNWALVLANTGEPERADEVMDQLAPDDKAGYAPAHRLKAVNLASQLDKAKDPLTLRKLRLHLENCRDESPEISRAWALYYLAVGQEDQALKYLQEAAESHPEFLLMIANIHQQKGREYQMEQTIEKAEVAFRQRIVKDPLDVKSRVALANVLARQSKFAKAEETLLTGLKLQPEELIRRETAGFYVMQHDLAAQQNREFDVLFLLLQKALALDENFQPVYQRLLLLHQKKPNPEEAGKIKDALFESVTSDNPSPMAHFALSNVLWTEDQKDEAEWHLEQAYKLEPNFAVVINNLAWMLSHKEEPDLDRALELSASAIQQAPLDPRFQDTYGTILMIQKNYEAAVSHFQKALPRTQISAEIHQKLATCYQQLGKPKLAALHQKRAEEAGEPGMQN
jgi:tetratricopeptide (TPR) repeat protein